jgi:hypothetical protein
LENLKDRLDLKNVIKDRCGLDVQAAAAFHYISVIVPEINSLYRAVALSPAFL